MLTPILHEVEAAAPGRMDVMGGIADYSGSLVLQMPIREATSVKIKFNTGAALHIESEGLVFDILLDQLLPGGKIDYNHARKLLKATPGGDWAAYVVGSMLVVAKEKGLTFQGADISVSSRVPLGKGVSSSAALEIAVCRALWKAYDLPESNATEIPLLAQKAENLIVGAPCGIMDQLASHLGKPGHLLPIECRPAKVFSPVAIPGNVHFVGIDSGVKHSVGGASYGDVRTGAYMGYTMYALHAGASVSQIKEARQSGHRDALPGAGYLANVSPSEFERIKHIFPGSIKGSEFLEKYGELIDPISEVQPEKVYEVFYPAKHPIYENMRVNLFRSLIASNRPEDLVLAGELMYQSHESYNDCRIGDRQTDVLVKMARDCGPATGIMGAKITGGGSGGTVCLMCVGETGLTAARKIHREYMEQVQKEVVFFENRNH